MNRTFLGIALILFVGCQGNSPQDVQSDVEANESTEHAKEQLASFLAIPLQQIAKGLEDSNPELFEQICRQRRITPLHLAASVDKVATVKALLSKQADVNAQDIEGNTPLHSAAFAFGDEVIPLLLEAGANINAKNNNGATPLHVAMMAGLGGGGEKAVPRLLKAKADVNAIDNQGYTPLIYACNFRGDISDVKQLIAAGADVNIVYKNGQSPLHWATDRNYDIAEALIDAGANVNAKNSDGETPLILAARDGWSMSERVELLLKSKADPNLRDKKDCSALVYAANRPDLDSAKALRKAGAVEPSWTAIHEAAVFENAEKMTNLLAEKPNVNKPDNLGRTPLYWALRCNDNKVVDLLMEAGADVKSETHDKASILHLATWANRLDIMKKCVAAGADVNAADEYGNTALCWAARTQNLDAVKFLLDQHAPVNCQTKSGETPMLLAVSHGELKLIKLLLDAGADVLATDSDGKSVKDRIWKLHDKEAKELLEKAIEVATEKQIDTVCFRYSPDNPQALKADDVQPTTPQKAAVKMYRAMLGPDRKVFTDVFVGKGIALKAVDALYSMAQDWVAFRNELRDYFGADAYARFEKLDVDGLRISFGIPILEESRFEEMSVDIQGDRAVCSQLPEMPGARNVQFLKQGGLWRIDASFLSPAAQPDAGLEFMNRLNRVLRKGRGLLKQSGMTLPELKRMMQEELKRR